MSKRTIVLFVFACLLCLAASGCFYLRLQQVKGQLARFEEYYEITEDEKIRIVAKEPVLLPDDVIRIMKQKPSAESNGVGGLFYDYTLEKQYPSQKDEADNYDINVRFIFTGDRFSECHIDKRFFAVIPKWMFIAILKAMGNAKIDIAKRSITGGAGSADANEIHLPDVNEVQMLLGKPYAAEGNVYTYKYLKKNPEAASSDEKDYLPAVFTFDDGGSFLKCRSELLGGAMEMDFSKWAKLKKTQAADSNSVKL
ncbi:MAG: hypothetical protein ABIG61_16030 [Planctomycetota bacterium]